MSGHNDFPAIGVRDAVSRAKFLGQPVPFHAKARLEKFGRIVDARMNDAAVAGTGGHAQSWRLLEQEDVFDTLGKFVRDGATHHTTADDHDVNSIHRKTARNGELQIRCAAHLSSAVAGRHGPAARGRRRYASWTRSREARLKHLRVAGNIACLSPVPPAAAEVVVGPHCD